LGFSRKQGAIAAVGLFFVGGFAVYRGVSTNPSERMDLSSRPSQGEVSRPNGEVALRGPGAGRQLFHPMARWDEGVNPAPAFSGAIAALPDASSPSMDGAVVKRERGPLKVEGSEATAPGERAGADVAMVGAGGAASVTGALSGAASGIPVTNVPATGIPTEKSSEVVAAPVVVEPDCVKLEYRAASKEVLKHAQNRVELAHAEVNAKSVCVRVDGVPVAWKFAADKKTVLFGGLNKPNSLVSVRYCRGKVECAESCVIPRDEFMEALAGSDAEAEESTLGWTGSKESSREQGQLDRELASFGELTDEDRKSEPYAKWSAEAPVEAEACGAKAAGRKTARLGH